ncbi:hypothetical protein BDM02DRAFT_3133425 [Thelephora ganbajun]|uniref:Uncharacterized protein n=1 Tax=Thelephora ganbajun TaxID=370292 RepID=A0ACB6YX08_THEGA|nr:hypothetical protein BDM02DRAFT_3133425 [Thelephora ganbajun]
MAIRIAWGTCNTESGSARRGGQILQTIKNGMRCAADCCLVFAEVFMMPVFVVQVLSLDGTWPALHGKATEERESAGTVGQAGKQNQIFMPPLCWLRGPVPHCGRPLLLAVEISRRSSSEVAAEKLKKKETAAAKAKKKHEQEERVAQVKKEIKMAQTEALQSSRQGQRDNDLAKEHPKPALKRKADMAQLFDEWERTESAKVAKITLLKEPSSTSPAALNKPHGLANAGRHPPPTKTIIEDFVYEDEGNGTQSDGEDGEDEIEYLGSLAESLVSTKSTNTSNVPSQATKDFIPAVLEEVGCSMTPWKNLDIDLLRGCMTLVYPGLDYNIEKGGPLDTSNAIGTAAVINVQNFMAKFKTPKLVEGYVKSGLIYYGEIPFLYRVFEPTEVRSSKEKGGYKVTRHGLFQNQAILDTMLIYYGKRGTKQHLPPALSPGSNPMGTECALLMHSTSWFIEDKCPFSEKFWGHQTAIYVKLMKELSTSQWNTFYTGLGYTEGVHEKLNEFSRPVKRWTDDPDEYFIVGSDPAKDK